MSGIAQRGHVRQAWDSLQKHLNQQPHPWYQVKGPMAVIVYMWEWQWHLTEPRLWHRDVQDYGPEMELDLNEPWWKIAAILQQESAHQRLRRLRQRKHCQHLRNGLDWHVYNLVLRQATKPQARALKTWVQGAIRHQDNQTDGACPICTVPATSKHIIWLRRWHHGKDHPLMPISWTERVNNPDEDPLWARGWINKEIYEHDSGAASIRGHGLWQLIGL